MEKIDSALASELRILLSTPQKIVLTIHYNPDGDSLGSSLALRSYLSAQGHQVEVIAPNSLPRHYTWMPGAGQIIDFERNQERSCALLAQADVIFCLDYNELLRTNKMEPYMRAAQATFVLIDHHPDPEHFTRYLFSDTTVSSASELTYEFLMALHQPERFSLEVAECLFTGIMTDTGMFQHNSSHPNTFRAVAKLLESGVDKDAIKYRIFDTNSIDRLRLMGFSLNERMVIHPQYRAGYIYLSIADMKRFNFKKGDHEGFVNFPLSVEGVRFSALIIEQEEYTKVSMRSKGDFDVNALMREKFEGGGHKNASGGRSYSNLQDTIARLEAIFPEYEQQLAAWNV